ncbi:hypothetical protein P4493_22805 [Bacillus thuringiensis]|jgi:hypothetical protein|uniref:Uncharacterized protein n=3 Tax=Bacillus thuringiensis TaxID=1428 RepID=A0AB35P974_BACTU|nr:MULTISPECIES: hypothetical protein [Bacillus]MED1157346.1 hypothetical protein [Bacillus paranthracis]AFQ25794.1 hypothetical protein BTF1_07915 [Bacillus thuringiensis HD-789]AJH08691.1 hypothetical protein AS86_1905 [Bacillus thuringiensis HD1002]AND23964.1 hypothetical protein ATN07_10440 [Bacillus thuringiensis serovar israelensis]EXL37818.1 hypothetical protein BG78_16485 [Bacillus thuringiensis serovar israelensis]
MKKSAKLDASQQEIVLKLSHVRDMFAHRVAMKDNLMLGNHMPKLKRLAKEKGVLGEDGQIPVEYAQAYYDEVAKVSAKVDKDFEEFKKAFDKYFGE